jgi:hypothetical protein
MANQIISTVSAASLATAERILAVFGSTLALVPISAPIPHGGTPPYAPYGQR